MIEFKYEFKDILGVVQSELVLKSYQERLPEIIQDFKNFLLSMGFHPDSVNEYFPGE